MDSEKVIKRDNEYVLHTYARNPIAIEKGHGLYAEGPEGQKYLDFTSGIGVNSLGYCDMTWAEAVSEHVYGCYRGQEGRRGQDLQRTGTPDGRGPHPVLHQ